MRTDQPIPEEVDLIVLGSGVAGLTAAVSASLVGLKAIILERSGEIGGTSARSSGTVWIPDNHHMRAHGWDDDAVQAEAYLEALVADRGDRAMRRAFLDAGPKMLADLEDRAGISFRPYLTAPDYRQEHPGAVSGGRALEPLPFDGRELGGDFARLAWPLPELMLFGAMMITRGEASGLLRADRSPGAMWLGVRLLTRYLLDRLSHRRGTRLVLGNALVARLLKSLRDNRMPVFTNARCHRLLENAGTVTGVAVVIEEREVEINAGRGVVLAGGGFPADADWRARHLPEPISEHTPAAPGCDASSLNLGLSVGAALGPSGLDNALWFPSSIATRDDGSKAVYPHIVLDRSKPGLIAVNGEGRRFTNEAVSYHEFVRAMYRANQEAPSIPAWLVCDRQFIRRYGLGLIQPRTRNLDRYIASGYLHSASTIIGLADSIDVNQDVLRATVSRYNGFAETGTDADFAKGENLYDRSNGDPAVAPNPCLGPIDKSPFFAVAVYPTPLGTSRGLLTDTNARACRKDGSPIPGLYVCGNDMQSAFGGEYPGAGAQLGQAMTFAWIAARHAANLGSATHRKNSETLFGEKKNE